MSAHAGHTSFALRVVLLDPRAVVPARGSPGAAGYDLSSLDGGVVPARGRLCVPTGLGIAVPQGTYGRIAPRSGLAAKHSIHVGAGVVDEDYRGEVKVLLFNLSDVDFEIKAGDRVAQLVLERVATPDVEVVVSLEDTERGEGGFGSTGN